MAPPASLGSDESGLIDPTYMRSQADYNFALGEALSLDGNTEGAIEAFRMTTVYDPDSSVVRSRLAAEYLRKGLLSEAIEQAETGLEKDPGNHEIRLFLAGIYAALKMYPQALEEYRVIYESDPGHKDVPFFMGAVYAEQGEYEKAEKYFLKATIGPDADKSHLAHFYIGRMHWAQEGEGHKAKAKKAYEKALSLNSGFEEAVIALYSVHQEEGKKAQGIKLLESFQAQHGPKKTIALILSEHFLSEENYEKALRHLIVLEEFEPSNMNVKMKIALIFLEQKNYDEAILKLEDILRIVPSADKVRFYLGAVHEELKNYDLAISNYRKIGPNSQYYPEASLHASFLLREAGKLNEAIRQVESALAIRQDVPKLYALYASFLDEKKEYSKAIDILTKATEYNPGNPQLHFYLGSMHDRLEDKDKTIYEMKRALDLDSDHVEALNYLAYTYAELGTNLNEAERLASRALELRPKDGYILDTMGWVLFKQGRVEEAIPYLEAAYRLKPNESVVADHLGDAYYVFDLVEKARDMYLRAVATEDDKDKLRKIQQKIVSIDNQVPLDRAPASLRSISSDY